MTIINIFSAIGNNSSIYPLIVRDCCIEAPSKIFITRKANLKESKTMANDASREKAIDEYSTSAIWLGGIPLSELIADKFIKKRGFCPFVNLKLFSEDKKEKNKQIQGIEYNINKFKDIQIKDVQDAVADLIKIKNNKSKFEKLLTQKFLAATIIPTIIMGFVLPPLNFALTKKLQNDRVKNNNNTQQATKNIDFTSSQINNFKTSTFKNNLSFTGSAIISKIANLRTVDKMAISDGGLTVGRISTSRNKDEGYVNAFRMIGSIILNFVTPTYIAKGLNKLTNKTLNINTNLDPLILDNKDFIRAIKENNFNLPKTPSEKDLIDFIDNNPQSLFSKFAQKTNKISYLKSGIRDPRKFVNISDLAKFRNEIEKFIKLAQNSKNIEKVVKKAKFIKCANILANVGISSFLLAGVLPKLQYRFNKLITGSYTDPGLKS